MEQETTPIKISSSSNSKRQFKLPKFGSGFDNPVILKELKGRMRDRRTFVLLTIYLMFIGLFVCAIYYFIAESLNTGATLTPDYRQNMGKAIFGTVVIIELLLVSFIGPGLTAGAITSEREHQTLDLLKTTLLTTRELVMGKLGAAVIYLILLIFTVLPFQSMAFILGGVGLAEVLISSLMLVVTAVFFSALGVFFSSIFKRTLAATVSSYGSILLSIFAIILFLFLVAVIETATYNATSTATNLSTIALWIVVATNPILAAIFSETILIDQQSIFWASSTYFGNSSIGVPSPWIIFVITYTLTSILMITISIYLVKRPER
ncbi:MAG: ABC transporter permease subunit [Anaerolineales bacterium]